MFRTRPGLWRLLIVALPTFCGVGRAGGQQCIYDWSPRMFEFPGPGVDGGVAAMVKYDDGDGEKLYVAGSFISAGGVRLNRIARLGAGGFEPLGSGLDGAALALSVFDDGTGAALYVTGRFQAAGDIPASNIARWKNGAWSALGAGLNNPARDLMVFDDGSGAALYAGGYFTNAGGQAIPKLAKWNGATWSAVGTGFDGDVWDLIVFDDGTGPALYATGSIQLNGGSSIGIARWNGGAWSASPSAPFSKGYSLGLFKDGAKTKLAASTTIWPASLQVWSGSSWSGLGVCPINTAWTIGTYDFGDGLRLYAGGDNASQTGGPPLARWNGATWEYIAGGPDQGASNMVRALLPAGPNAADGVYVGGAYTTAGGEPVNNVGLCRPSASQALGGVVPANGLNAAVRALVEFGDGHGRAIFAGGSFTHAGAQRVNHVARWNGSDWATLNGGTNGVVRALVSADLGDGLKLYAAGDFTSAGGVAADHVAVWNGASWAPVGAGLNQWVGSLIGLNDGTGPALYAAGGFTASGTTATLGVAKWSGSTWEALGSGFADQGSVYALCAYDDGGGPALYAAGRFTRSGSATVKRAARWNGSVWEQLGPTGLGAGFPDYGRAMTVGNDGSGPALYIGGFFGPTDGIPAYHLIRWNGSWSKVGSGFSNQANVTSLAFFDDGLGPKLYVSGGFSTLNGDPGDGIARWDGLQWNDAGSSLGGGAYAMCSVTSDSKPTMYVGGNFTLAGDRPAAFLAKWTCRYIAGDLNCDGTINQFDIQGFITALTDAAAYAGAYPDCDIRTADANRDGTVNQFDIQPFVELLLP